jgi:hypothetical protein
VTVPTGQIISQATLKIYAYTGSGGTTARARITADAEDNPDAPSSASGADGLTPTGAYADWTPDVWTDHVQYTAPDLAAVIQEIVSRGSWASGNSILLLLKDNGSDEGATRCMDYDTGNGYVASLYLEWAPPAPETKVIPTLSDTDTGVIPTLLGLNLTAIQYGSLTDADTAIAPDLIYPRTYNDTLDEYLALAESFNLGLGVTVAESFFAYDNTALAFLVAISEGIGIADAASNIWGLFVDDWLTLIDAYATNWVGREIITDGFEAWETLTPGQLYSATASDGLGIADTVIGSMLVYILEELGFADLASVISSLHIAVSELLELDESLLGAYPESLSEALGIADVGVGTCIYLNAIAESLGITDAATVLRAIALAVSDPITFVETVSSSGRLYSTLYDLLNLDVSVDIAGDVWECYALNTPKFYPSMYSGFDFNSYAVYQDRVFGANDDGIYELTGTTDAGSNIHTGVILSATDFSMPHQKRFRRGYLSLSGDAPMMIFENETGQREAYSIDVQGKVVASSELKGKKWKLTVVDFSTLDHIKLIPVILTK